MKRIEFYKWALDGLKTTHYFYEWVDLKEDWAEAKIFEVNAWNMDGEIKESEQIMKVIIKWDGCSHVTYTNEGYVHLCGKHYWIEHSKMLVALYESMTSFMTKYDKEVAE